MNKGKLRQLVVWIIHLYLNIYQGIKQGLKSRTTYAVGALVEKAHACRLQVYLINVLYFYKFKKHYRLTDEVAEG